MILSITLLCTRLLRILLSHDYFFAATRKVKHTEEELCALFCTFFHNIIRFELQMVVLDLNYRGLILFRTESCSTTLKTPV